MHSEQEPSLALRPAQAARAIGVSPRQLWSLTARGEIPVVRVGRRCVLIRVSALNDWLAARETKGVRSDAN